MAPKRKHVALTIQQKYDIVQKLKKGYMAKDLAMEYNVGTSTISDIKKHSDKIEEFIGHCVTGPGTKKSLRKAEYPEMEVDLRNWFLIQRQRHAVITSDILSEKAKQLYQKHYGDNKFLASRGWLTNFKKRHGLRCLKVSGEKLSNNPEAVEPFLVELQDKIKELNLSPRQIYNADESALFWKMLPDRTLAHIKERSAPGRKICKERITFLACTNGDGSHKLNLLVIGKAKNPRSFKNVQIPLEYKSTKNSWMTSALFKQWFHESFVKQVKTFLRSRNLEETALLIVDNAPSHATKEELVSEDGNIVTMFLPPNCTALIQPMDQNVIRLTKMHYRKSILATIISSDEQDITKSLKSVTLKDAMFILNDAWSKIPSKTIEKCWRNILSKTTQAVSSDTEYDSDDLMPLSVLKEKIGQQNLTDNIQDNISGMLNQLGGKETSFTHLDVDQWIDADEELVPDLASGENSEEEVEIVPELKNTVKHQDAVNSFNVCLQWAEENDVELPELVTLRRLRETAMIKNLKTCRQTKITHFFTNPN